MSYKIYYKGDDIIIPFRAWKDTAKTQALNLYLETIEIKAEIYTDPADIKTYWKTAGEGRNLLSKISSSLYNIVIDSSVTALMNHGLITVKLTITFSNSKLDDGRQDLSVKTIYGELTIDKISLLDSLTKEGEGDIIEIVFTGLNLNTSLPYILPFNIA